MRLLFFHIVLVSFLKSYAQTELILQKESCEKDSSSVWFEVVNHKKDSFQSIELEKRSFAYSLVSPNLMYFDNSCWFREGGLFQLVADSCLINQPRRFGDSLSFFRADNGCHYTLNIVDSSTKYFVGYKFYLPLVFDLDQAEILSRCSTVLSHLRTFLQENTNLVVEIGVHFDEWYPQEYSTCLSCQRAEAIVEYLGASGISKSRLSAKGYQGSEPFFIGASNGEEHQLNRRIIVKVISTD